MRITLTPLLLIAVCTCVRAQSETYRDSLHRVLATATQDSVRVNTYANLVWHYLDAGDTLATERYLDTLRAVSLEAADPHSLGAYHYLRGQRENRAQRWQRTLTAADRALGYFREAGVDQRIFEAHFLAGKANMRLGDREEALHRQLQALEYARAANNEQSIFQAVNEIGNLHRRSNNLDQADRYYRESLDLARAIGGAIEESAALNNLAILRKNQGRYAEAAELYRQGVVVAARIDAPQRYRELGYHYTNLANLGIAQEDPRQSLRYGRLALENFERNGRPRERAAAMIGLATALGKLNDYGGAETYYRGAKKEGRLIPGIVRASNQGLIEVFKRVGPLDSAVHYLEAAAEQDRQANESNRVEAIAEMEARFQAKEKQAAIDRLALADELSQARISQQRWLLFGGLGLVVCLVTILFVLYRQRARIRRQNVLVSRALAEKEVLLKEIHHRVKNNLQMVSSLLSLQTEFMEEGAAVDALRKGEGRVRSMAIIHQKLYMQDEVVTTVNTKEYLDQLIGELMATLNVGGQSLRLVKDIEAVELDIDRMIPLGLIVNEAITNAMKHAFIGREAGELRVRLRRSGDHIELVVADDGPGLKEDLQTTTKSFGSLLIRIFAEQLNGKLSIDGRDGTELTLTFPRESDPGKEKNYPSG